MSIEGINMSSTKKEIKNFIVENIFVDSTKKDILDFAKQLEQKGLITPQYYGNIEIVANRSLLNIDENSSDRTKREAITVIGNFIIDCIHTESKRQREILQTKTSTQLRTLDTTLERKEENPKVIPVEIPKTEVAKVEEQKIEQPEAKESTDTIPTTQKEFVKYIETKYGKINRFTSTPPESFHYGEDLKENGLSPRLKELYIQMLLKKSLNKTITETINGKNVKIKFTKEYIEENKEKLIHNFEQLLIIFMGIESHGGINEDNPKSSASGFYQFMTANWSGKPTLNKNGKTTNNYSGWKNRNERRRNFDFTSYETAMRLMYMDYAGFNKDDKNYMKGEKLVQPKEMLGNKYDPKRHKDVPKWLIDAYNAKTQDIKTLSAEQQTELFMYDIFLTHKTYRNKLGKRVPSSELIPYVAIGNTWALEQLYKSVHHTNADGTTSRVFIRVLKEHGGNIERMV